MSSNKGSNGGCFAIVGLIFLIGIALWTVNIALWILGFAMPIVGIAGGVYFFIKAKQVGDQGTSHADADREFDELVDDARYELATTITQWDNLVQTKGIGTELEDQGYAIANIQQRLWAANEALNVAATPHHKAEAVNQADSLRREAEKYL
ncbi:hypothetical protein QP027_08810 [Corynebacterium breve]|uniref:DUF2746 domain-containing protein n=1 Tax=Corynebacterium breve TaxID=3049799 RepID=A0ABY8VC15_9CORY|nr:hypothetical protein [Corynebacterium breve]WIM67215.1 hypothetical protein QP027_08810 [Corynebacterium breve]